MATDGWIYFSYCRSICFLPNKMEKNNENSCAKERWQITKVKLMSKLCPCKRSTIIILKNQLSKDNYPLNYFHRYKKLLGHDDALNLLTPLTYTEIYYC